MGLIDTIINALKAIFGGNKTSASQPTPEPTADQPATSSVEPDSRNIDGTRMRKDVFNVMTAGEKDASVIEHIKAEMRKKDEINIYPYTISTDMYIYTINRAIDKYGNDYTSEYGTQFSADPKHK